MNRVLATLLVMFLFVAAVDCPAADPELTVAIAIPHVDNQPGLLHWEKTDRTPHFPVLLTNASAEPKRIFQEWCSWGYSALSFEVTDENGKTSTIHKMIHGWTVNFPAFWTIQPQESFVIDVYFADRDIWGDGFWLPPGHPTGKVTLKAIYQVTPDEHSRKHSVWTGEIASKPVTCIIK